MRRFIQEVSMPCTEQRFESDLKEKLTAIGRSFSSYPWSGCEFIVADDCGFFFPNQSAGYDLINKLDSYNPELFLALAAMSEGDEMFPGEWVVSTHKWSSGIKDGTMTMVEKTHEGSFNCEHGLVYSTHFRKATAEEIVAHFTEKKTVEQEAAEFADKVKLSKAVEEWVPKPFEPIWVWNNGDKQRMKMLFGFFSETTIFAFEEQFETWSNFEVHEFQNFAKIDAPVRVPLEYVKNLIALERGVPAELVQIDL